MSDDSRSILNSDVETVRLEDAGTQRRAERLAARKERNRSFNMTDAAHADGVEALACPQCKERFDCGSTCPACEVWLVGESMVDVATPFGPGDLARASRRRRNRILTIAIAIGALGAALSWASTA